MIHINKIPGSSPASGGISPLEQLRPIFKLGISNFGVCVKQILKRRRWAFLARFLIS